MQQGRLYYNQMGQLFITSVGGMGDTYLGTYLHSGRAAHGGGFTKKNLALINNYTRVTCPAIAHFDSAVRN